MKEKKTGLTVFMWEEDGNEENYWVTAKTEQEAIEQADPDTPVYKAKLEFFGTMRKSLEKT